jgi:hypothetical protein
VRVKKCIRISKHSLAIFYLLLLLAISPAARGQDLARQPTAFTAWIDFGNPTGDLPIWIEGVEKQKITDNTGQVMDTVTRIRFRHFPGLVDEVSLRVYFDDEPNAQPALSGWTELGVRVLGPRTLGQGLGLPSSETVNVPLAGLDYVEIETPGDIERVRGALALALHTTETREGLDFGGTEAVTDPFGNGSPAVTGTDDVLLFGRVKATLEPGVVPLGSPGSDGQAIEYDFPLERPPLIALLTFEMLNANVSTPPKVSVNGNDLGDVSVSVPDLADPALTGAIEGGRPDAVYRYGGWLKCQKIIPGSMLTAGTNALLISNPGNEAPVALRSIEVQLKYTTDANSP